MTVDTLKVAMGHEHSNLEDQLLVMDAQDGQSEAMEALVHRWQQRLWRHAFRLTGNPDASWDVTQSAWYDIIRRLSKLHDPASFPAWAYKITTCKSIDWIKKAKRHRNVPIENAEVIVADEENISWDMEELISKLDIDKRAVLSLYYFEQLSITEISEVLKIPAGTVKSRLHAARNELKKLYGLS